MNSWEALVIAALPMAAAGGLLTRLVDHWLERRRRRLASAPVVAVQAVHAIYQVLVTLLAETDARRIVLLRAENSGQIPRAGQPLYVTVAYEVHQRGLRRVAPEWQRRAVDQAYVSTLVELAARGAVELEVAQLPAGVLRTVYEADGIHTSWVRSLISTPTAWFYLSIPFAAGAQLDPLVRARVDGAVAQLQQILQDQHAVSVRR
jgi:hypothetical protein